MIAAFVVGFSAAFFSLSNGGSQQRGHRGVRPQDLDDLPISWARQCKLAQIDGRVPESHDGLCVATFAAGCYWGPELAFQRQHGVVATCVGHTGYESGGANEAVQLVYDPSETSYEALCDVLWEYVDPTLKDQVGNDRGRLYRHVIYVHGDEQQQQALESKARLQAATSEKIWTEVVPAELFYVASVRHQRYLERGMKGEPQCASKGCTDPIRCYGGNRAGGPVTMQIGLGTGFEFDDGEQLLVSVQKPIGMVLEEAEPGPGCVVADVLDDSAAENAGIMGRVPIARRQQHGRACDGPRRGHGAAATGSAGGESAIRACRSMKTKLLTISRIS